ncbi:MAG TPA: nickel-responsive transcriptional regulator NikR [bacterium]|nr:nickel-responsive transcriptional regulator NikR [bacterium]HOL47457.1 nickel-responsive transcriptional regulator NikR [bacterium]HPQ18937.1 nickel-responsive transcriptional regulator NikR [bacterium]
MEKLKRFGVSIEKELLLKFDKYIQDKNYTNRSEAIRDLIRKEFVFEQWKEDNSEVAGAITIIYDHHKRELVNRLLDIQHNYQECIIATQHIHLDHHNCLEIIAVKGSPKKLEELANKLRVEKGVKHSTLNMTTTGKNI